MKKHIQLLKIGCLSLIVVGLIQLFVNPASLLENYVNVVRIQKELPTSKARWQSSKISDYQIDVKGFIPLSCWADAQLSIRDGKLAAVAIRENIADDRSPFIQLVPDKWDGGLWGCNYNDFTIDQMIDRVDRVKNIDVWEVALNVQFDTQYGYITSYETRDGYRTGGVSECCVWFEYKNFQPK